MAEDFSKATPMLPLMAHDGDIWTDYGDGVPGIPVFRRASQDRRWGVRLTDEQFDTLAALIVAAVNGYSESIARIAETEKALREAEGEKALIMKMVKEFSCFACCWPILSEEEEKEVIDMAATLDNRIEDALASIRDKP